MNASPLRCLAVWLAATAVTVLAVRLLGADAGALADGPGPDVEIALVRVGSLALLGCAGWAWLATTAVVLQAARGRATGPTYGVPTGLRRLVLAACGVGLVAGLATPATADPGLAGLPLPDRATGTAQVAPVVAPPAAPPDTVTVHLGDSLWTLAAADLGPGASAAQVEQQWRQLYRLNRPVVGPDPDLVHPGQQLRLPPPPQETP